MMPEKRLLLVDDEENILRSLKRLLHNREYIIETANDGNEGLAKFRAGSYPLVISDYRMPGMNGVEFLRRVREIAPDSIRMIITGYADTDIAVSAINEGHIYKFISKPWNEDQLLVHIRRAFEFHELLTERKRLNAELIEKNRELEDINSNLERIVGERTQQLLHSEKLATLGQIAGQIGHEINNSLTVLKGRMQLLSNSDFEPESVRRTFEAYKKEFERLNVYARNLLSFGRPDAPEFKDISIRQVVEYAIESLLSSGIIKYYTIIRHYDESNPAVFGDAGQLHQALTNILVNAHHAMNNAGELTIEIAVMEKSQYAEIRVRDTGHGIPRDIIEKVFDPFYTTKPEGQGTGLGLSIVRQIIESHGGYVRLESEEGRGTMIIIELPLAGTGHVQTGRLNRKGGV